MKPTNEENSEAGVAADERAQSSFLTLDRLAAGVDGRVVAVDGKGPVARRLLEMGVVPGAPVRLIKAAPLGDPFEIRVRNYHLALRRSEAEMIRVVINGA